MGIRRGEFEHGDVRRGTVPVRALGFRALGVPVAARYCGHSRSTPVRDQAADLDPDRVTCTFAFAAVGISQRERSIHTLVRDACGSVTA
jgi:hypothetical protein